MGDHRGVHLASSDPTTGRRAAGRPATIGRGQIAAAALAEVDGLTLSAVARRLGVAKSALYHHVTGRDELVFLAAGAALETYRRPDPGLPWREFVARFAGAVHECLLAHPGLETTLLELHVAPPAMARELAWAVQVCASAGVARERAEVGVPMLTTVAVDDARHRRARAEWPTTWFDARVALITRGLES
jgi:AcrR family transcriptional regulator